jgi:hypothetical protein
MALGPDMRYYVHASTEGGKAQQEYLRDFAKGKPWDSMEDIARADYGARYGLWIAIAIFIGYVGVAALVLWLLLR